MLCAALDNLEGLCKAKSHANQTCSLMRSQTADSGRRILKNGGWLLAPKSIGAVLSLVYLALIARSLGPTRFGTFALMFSFAQSVAGIAAFQTWQIIIRYGSQPFLEGRLDKIAQLIYLCVLLDVTALIIGTAISGSTVGWLSGRLGWDSSMQWEIFALTFLLMLSSRSTPTGLLRLFDNFKFAAFIDSLVPILRFIGVLLVYSWEPTASKYLIIWVLSESLPTIVIWAFIMLRIHLPAGQIRVQDTLKYTATFPDFLTYAFWSSVNSSLRFMNQQTIIVVVGFFTNAASAGFFRLGHQLGQVLARISDGLSMAFFLEFAKVDAKMGATGAEPLVKRTLLITIMSSLCILVLLLLGGRAALLLVFGAEFLPAFPFVMILGTAAAVQVGSMAFEPVLMSRGYAKLTVLANLAGALSMILFLALLLPQYKALGAAIAVLLSALISAAAISAAYWRISWR
jgi:O-antigen/teichoic acid export membrane protein